MDRNNRYARRCGVPTDARSGERRLGGERVSSPMPSAPTDRCLCDSQPIALAMSYVKKQPYDGVFDAGRAWQHGTLFPSLVMPYVGGRSR
ncbi:MAG: spore coat associated protein CotJA [Ruminococcaceae bacterium]|nr:spore coat associated protein CotJA [Oscillospiraceae bacterium]